MSAGGGVALVAEVRKTGRYLATVVEDDLWLASDGAVAKRGEGGKKITAGHIHVHHIVLEDPDRPRADNWYLEWGEYQSSGYAGADPGWDEYLRRRVEAIARRKLPGETPRQ